MAYKLIIADDHKMFLDGLLYVLNDEKDYQVVMTSKNGENVLKYLEINSSKDIDLVITDISMPHVNGIELNKVIKKKYPQLKTLIVSMHHDALTIKNLIQDQVNGYISKDTTMKELLLAIKTIISGENYYSDFIKEKFVHGFFSNENTNLSSSLTKRELEILKLIAKELTSNEIAQTLMLSKHTVEHYRKNLILKLDVRNIAGLTKYAIKFGLID